MTDAYIYVCQSGTCRSKGSDAALVEIEELANLVEDCNVKVEKTGCLGYCRQGPAVATAKKRSANAGRKSRSSKRNTIDTVHVKVNTIKKSVKVVEQATDREVLLENLPPQSEARLAEIRATKRREYFISTYQWNKALSGLLTEPVQKQVRNETKFLSDYEMILDKAGYSDIDPLDLVRNKQSQSYLPLKMPNKIENYVPWILKSVEIISKHTAIFKFMTKDLKRGTPHPRGRGRMAEPVTWHVTMLGEVGQNEEGPLPWIERDYTPISGALEWERGTCDILIKIYGDGSLTSWLKETSNGHCHVEKETKIWLSKPIKTLSVPSLAIDIDDDDDNFRPASVLLLLAGSGIVALPQILAHREPYKYLGIATPRYAQLPCPIDLIQSCRVDDVLLLPSIKEYCLEGARLNNNPKKPRGLRNYTLLLTDKYQDQSNLPPYHNEFKNDDSEDMAIFSDVPNAKVIKSQRLDRHIIADAIKNLEEPYRIVVSGPDAFNNAAREFLDDHEVNPAHLTVLSA